MIAFQIIEVLVENYLNFCLYARTLAEIFGTIQKFIYRLAVCYYRLAVSDRNMRIAVFMNIFLQYSSIG